MTVAGRRLRGARTGRRLRVVALVGVLLVGCAAYDGSGLTPGKSTAADVEALMGQPDEKQAAAGGSSVWFYTRPSGGNIYAVRLGSDGIVRGVDNRLTEDNIATLEAGISRREDVRALLGPPYFVSHFERQQREVWEYKRFEIGERKVLLVQFSDDGLMREIVNAVDYDYVPASASDAKD
jgi:outer membrane protein assembly factor BamE (lipoprotein component of BamABCDE complex)